MVRIVRRRARGTVPPGRLYTAIETAGLTLREFAAAVDMHPSTVWRIDRGVAQPAESDWYERAALVLGVRPEDISPAPDAELVA